MRHAIVADLHGKWGAWRRVAAAAARAGADRIVCLGDYLEANVSNRRHDPSRRWAFADVVKDDERLWRSLAGEADLVLGNQEWRIRDLLRPDQVPDALAPLLAAPEVRRFGAARAEHGHRITWTRRRPPAQSDGPLLPDLGEVFPERLLLVGHTHQALLLAVTPSSAGPRLRAVPAPLGVPVAVPAAGHLFANVGQARGHPSHWLIYDDHNEEVTYLVADD